MKTTLSIFLLVISLPAFSIGVNCGNKLAIYRYANTASIDICPGSENNLSIYANAIGGNSHSCNLEAIAIKKDNVYYAKSGKCVLSFTITGNELNATFGHGCKYYCGARAGWTDGLYIK